jgi:hypothetical protein
MIEAPQVQETVLEIVVVHRGHDGPVTEFLAQSIGLPSRLISSRLMRHRNGSEVSV